MLLAKRLRRIGRSPTTLPRSWWTQEIKMIMIIIFTRNQAGMFIKIISKTKIKLAQLTSFSRIMSRSTSRGRSLTRLLRISMSIGTTGKCSIHFSHSQRSWGMLCNLTTRIQATLLWEGATTTTPRLRDHRSISKRWTPNIKKTTGSVETLNIKTIWTRLMTLGTTPIIWWIIIRRTRLIIFKTRTKITIKNTVCMTSENRARGSATI